MTEVSKIRLDKWLWAARFYKTRSVAKQAIEGGKVHYDGQRVKVSKEVRVGAMLLVRQGHDEKEIEVMALSDKRRGAPEAALLYQETQTSIKKRDEASAQRKVLNAQFARPDQKPNKKDRRQIHRFKQQNIDSDTL